MTSKTDHTREASSRPAFGLTQNIQSSRKTTFKPSGAG